MEAVLNPTMWEIIQSIKKEESVLEDWKGLLSVEEYKRLEKSFFLDINMPTDQWNTRRARFTKQSEFGKRLQVWNWILENETRSKDGEWIYLGNAFSVS